MDKSTQDNAVTLGIVVHGHVAALGPWGRNVSLAPATGVHTTDNCVILDKHCGRSAVATGSVVILSSASGFSG